MKQGLMVFFFLLTAYPCPTVVFYYTLSPPYFPFLCTHAHHFELPYYISRDIRETEDPKENKETMDPGDILARREKKDSLAPQETG